MLSQASLDLALRANYNQFWPRLTLLFSNKWPWLANARISKSGWLGLESQPKLQIQSALWQVVRSKLPIRLSLDQQTYLEWIHLRTLRVGSYSKSLRLQNQRINPIQRVHKKARLPRAEEKQTTLTGCFRHLIIRKSSKRRQNCPRRRDLTMLHLVRLLMKMMSWPSKKKKKNSMMSQISCWTEVYI